MWFLAPIARSAVRPFILRVALACGFGFSFPAPAAELLVFAEKHCAPCQWFEREVGSIYPKTAEGRRAPLQRLVHGRPAPPAYAFVTEVRRAPTFVLVDAGREIGRFEGYSGDELFWMNLATLMQQLPD